MIVRIEEKETQLQDRVVRVRRKKEMVIMIIIVIGRLSNDLVCWLLMYDV